MKVGQVSRLGLSKKLGGSIKNDKFNVGDEFIGLMNNKVFVVEKIEEHPKENFKQCYGGLPRKYIVFKEKSSGYRSELSEEHAKRMLFKKCEK